MKGNTSVDASDFFQKADLASLKSDVDDLVKDNWKYVTSG